MGGFGRAPVFHRERERDLSPRRNYGFARRRREVQRQTRQEAKRERRAEREAQGTVGPEMGAPQDGAGAPAGQWEWFSPSRGRVVTTQAGQRPADLPDDWIVLTEPAEGEGESEGSGTAHP